MNYDDDVVSGVRPPEAGFRLAKLEVYNWGTFDGEVYSVAPRGTTTLLVGENGSGKSTLVDALLTLLVRPQTRNYNVAAGATKNERDEKTYIRGAYDRTVGESGRPQIQYLRSGHGHYTALLACFANQETGGCFTLCQILYLNSENGVERIYAYADSERGIVQDLGNLSMGSGVAKILKERGFQTTASYKQYMSWVQRRTGFRPKAMDIFNQTVAVKDVQRLDLFIRQHMLEVKPWKEKVDRLLNHFSELSEAHRMLVKVRLQDELLRPISEMGDKYRERQADILETKKQLDATPLYFATETRKLLEPLCDKWRQQIDYYVGEIERLNLKQNNLHQEIARLRVDIENAGGDRLRRLPGLIEQQEQIARVKLEARTRFESQLQTAQIEHKLTSPEQFHKLRQVIHLRREKWIETRQKAREASNAMQYQVGGIVNQLNEERSELEALQKRKNNLPESMVAMRDSMCKALKLAPSDLPFAAELVSVAVDQREWEGSIEQVLHGFARSLLVSNDFYSRVAGYVDRTRMVDGRGQGQRLVYLKIGVASSLEKGAGRPKENTLPGKLQYREDHPLAPWMKAEIQGRFNYLACETIEEFQRSRDAAMTRNRHVKSGGMKHEKDDRSHSDDRRGFVLGWDNREKKAALAESIQRLEDDLESLQNASEKWNRQIDQASAAIEALDQALQIDSFETIDHARHEFEASQLKLERKKIEESDDQIKQLKKRVADLSSEVAGYQTDRDDLIAKRTELERDLKNGARVLENAKSELSRAEDSGASSVAEEEFETIAKTVGTALTVDNLGMLPAEVLQKMQREYDRVREKLQPIARELTSAMTRFLKKFPDEQADLDADVLSLSSFEALYERIAKDDLPKHEERFKQRLNEKVLHEIGLLHGSLEDDRQDIRDKIEQLNGALKLLDWKPGTFMRLEPSDVQDREIQDFRRELAGCLSGTLDGSTESNEATFVRIEKMVAKLRDEANDRWRQKVIDVRNWFNFAAREIVRETGEARSFYDGGTGQSGGEKGKLAFLVLVAAIAYQYDIDPNAEKSDRFHFVMVDEMFSRSDDQHAEYALNLFGKFGLQLLIVAPLDAKARVTESYVKTYLHVVKNKQTHRSSLLSITADELEAAVGEVS